MSSDEDIYVDTIHTLIVLKEKGSSFLQRVSHLDLDTRNIGDKEVSIILSVIPDLSIGRLKYINLSHNRRLKNHSVALILLGLLGLPVSSPNQYRNLWFTEAEEVQIQKEIADKNIRRCRLEYIYLDNCNLYCMPFRSKEAPFQKTFMSNVGSLHFQIILKALLMFSPYLKGLSLSENQAFSTSHGLSALMPVLKRMKLLSSLSLCRLKWVATDGSFSSHMANLLSSLLPHLPLLKKIDLRQNCLTTNDIQKLVDILPSIFLHCIDLDGNPGSADFPKEAISSILKENGEKLDVIIDCVMMEEVFDKIRYEQDVLSSDSKSQLCDITSKNDKDLPTSYLAADTMTSQNSLQIPRHLAYYEILSYLNHTCFPDEAKLAFYNTFMCHKMLEKHRMKNMSSIETKLSSSATEEEIVKYPYELKADNIYEDLKDELSKSMMLLGPPKATLKDLRSRITTTTTKVAKMVHHFEGVYNRAVRGHSF